MDSTKDTGMVVETTEAEPRWLVAGPPYEFTRGELLELLHIMGHPMTERRLRNWADADLLPPPTRRTVPPRATDGVARALYPVWTIALLAKLCQRSEGNETIGEMQAALPEIHATVVPWGEHDFGLDLLLKHRVISLRDGRPIARRLGEGFSTAKLSIDEPQMTRALQRAAWDYAADYTSHAPAERLYLVVISENGERLTVAIPPPPPPRTLRRKRDNNHPRI